MSDCPPVRDTTDNSNLTYVLRIDVVDQELKKRAARRYANWFTARLHALFESQEEPKMNDHSDPPIGDTNEDAQLRVEELSAEHRDRVWKDRAGNVWRWVDCRWEYERPDSAVFYSPATMQNSDMGPFTLARPVEDTTDHSDEIAELCRILNSVGIDTDDGWDGPLIEALMAWKFPPVGDTTDHRKEQIMSDGKTLLVRKDEAAIDKAAAYLRNQSQDRGQSAELLTATQVLKIQEEAGEAAAVLVEMLTVHTLQRAVAGTPRLIDELCEVTISAMVALALVAGEEWSSDLSEHIAAR